MSISKIINSLFNKILYRIVRLLENSKKVHNLKRFGSVGLNFDLDANVFIWSHGKINIGNNCSIRQFAVLYGGGGITIGDRVRIGIDAKILSVTHDFSIDNFNEIDIYKPVVIGNRVWIGAGATILPGVIIGNNVIIATNAVITKNVPDDEIWAGVPAKCIKRYRPK